MLNQDQKRKANLMLLRAKKLSMDVKRESAYQKEHIALFGKTHADAEEVFASIIARGRALKRDMETFRYETNQDPFEDVEVPDTLPEDL